jgi:hypothetical protein
MVSTMISPNDTSEILSVDALNAGPVVPATIEDHDLTSSRKALNITLHEHLGLFAVRWSWQRHDP